MRIFLLYLSNTSYLLHSSRKVLRQYWFPRSDFPCSNIIWTCEHVIPKSLIQEHNDLHNLILLPDRLNHARSNYPYVNGIGYDDLHNSNLKIKIIPPCIKSNCSCELNGKLTSNHLFIPPDRFKGMIGRTTLYMKDKYPHHEKLINNRVLNLGVASIWDMSFPPSQMELDWNKFILSYQGDENPYVENHFISDKSHK